jgi:hypothetical protein
MRKEKILDVINFFISVSRDVIRFSNPGGLAVCFKGSMHCKYIGRNYYDIS